MIAFENVSKSVIIHGEERLVLSSVNIHIPSDQRIALFATSKEELRILIELLAGIVLPSSGRIIRKARVSFPVGYLGGFDGQLTVRRNVAHVARLYGADPEALVEHVERIAYFGAAFDRPFRDLPQAGKILISHIVAYSISFDLYLLNADPGRVPKEIREIAWNFFEARARTCGMIVATDNQKFAREHCQMRLLLHDGQLRLA